MERVVFRESGEIKVVKKESLAEVFAYIFFYAKMLMPPSFNLDRTMASGAFDSGSIPVGGLITGSIGQTAGQFELPNCIAICAPVGGLL